MKRRLRHEQRVLLLTLAGGLPAVLFATWIIWSGTYAPKVQWTVTIVTVGAWIGFGIAVKDHVVYRLQTLSNLIAAVSEGDFSMRARYTQSQEALGLVHYEINQLTDTLQDQRRGAVEVTTLFQKVISEIDVAVFAFDGNARLVLVNRAGERLFARPAKDLLGQPASALRLDGCLEGETPRLMEDVFAGGTGRWELRRGSFRQGGRAHQLLVLSDLSRTLREEERQAWKRLVRVLSHEINNSLAPIKSLSDSAERLVASSGNGINADVARSLHIIGTRADALIRFMQSYARIARLPEPDRTSVDVPDLIRGVARLDTRVDVVVEEGPDITIDADSDQLEQLLINVVANATDAALETGGGVRASWRVDNGTLAVEIEDDGPGISDTANLFVPFYTTKPSGTGVGLVLSRQIAEAHGGTLKLENRPDSGGCRATLTLPIRGPITPSHPHEHSRQ